VWTGRDSSSLGASNKGRAFTVFVCCKKGDAMRSGLKRFRRWNEMKYEEEFG